MHVPHRQALLLEENQKTLGVFSTTTEIAILTTPCKYLWYSHTTKYIHSIQFFSFLFEFTSQILHFLKLGAGHRYITSVQFHEMPHHFSSIPRPSISSSSPPIAFQKATATWKCQNTISYCCLLV
jgi:hypothetical protein